MHVVARHAELAVLVPGEVHLTHVRHRACEGLHERGISGELVVGVGEITRRWCDVEDPRVAGSRHLAHEEHEIVLFRCAVHHGVDPKCVHTAASSGRDGPRQGGLPLAVRDVVVVEVDGPVLVDGVAVGVFRAVPVEAGHGAHRHVVRGAVQTVHRDVPHPSDVPHADGGEVLLERPGRHDTGNAVGVEHGPRDLLGGQNAIGEPRPVELAVEVRRRHVTATGERDAVARREERGDAGRRGEATREAAGGVMLIGTTRLGVQHPGAIATANDARRETDRATLRIDSHRCEIPHRGGEAAGKDDLLGVPASVLHAEGQFAIPVQEQRPTTSEIVVPLGDERLLPAEVGKRRPHHHLGRHACQSVELGRGLDLDA